MHTEVIINLLEAFLVLEGRQSRRRPGLNLTDHTWVFHELRLFLPSQQLNVIDGDVCGGLVEVMLKPSGFRDLHQNGPYIDYRGLLVHSRVRILCIL